MTNKEFNKLRNMMLCILSKTNNENYERTHYILTKAMEQFCEEREYEKELQMHGYDSFTEFINDLLEISKNKRV